MSESSSNSKDNGSKRDDSDPLHHPLFREVQRKLEESRQKFLELAEEERQARLVENASSTNNANDVLCGENIEKNDLPKENNNGDNMIQSNDSMHELEESFVMVESFTSTTTSPKTARFELVEKDEHLQDGNAK
ncbi:predicted protein [Chaetoceros tenuissimus]|uniref:Uncharacterized protein n=1 Tax=Chaetoceros tenuissimus TaxID=426638 RepID=A0AAD3CV45_9STRA|nr:predicted protein [Chaetoceros tenuissimus]